MDRRRIGGCLASGRGSWRASRLSRRSCSYRRGVFVVVMALEGMRTSLLAMRRAAMPAPRPLRNRRRANGRARARRPGLACLSASRAPLPGRAGPKPGGVRFRRHPRLPAIRRYGAELRFSNSPPQRPFAAFPLLRRSRTCMIPIGGGGNVMQEDVGKLVVRLGVGGLLLLHGVHKLLTGIAPIKALVVAAHLPDLIAYGVYLGEIAGPILVILGLFSPHRRRSDRVRHDRRDPARRAWQASSNSTSSAATRWSWKCSICSADCPSRCWALDGLSLNIGGPEGTDLARGERGSSYPANRKCPRSAAMGLSSSSCHICACTLTTRRPCRASRALA